MRRSTNHVVLAISAVSLTLFGSVTARQLSAQETLTPVPLTPTAGATKRDSSLSWGERFRRYPWNGVNVWAGTAYETRTASHNEHFRGSMRLVAVQISRDLFRGRNWTLGYVGEVLPVMLVRSGPPVNRVPDTITVRDPIKTSQFRYRDAYGFGLAPFGLELSRRIAPNVSALFNTTAGALLFDHVVPYGGATRANFTVSPGIALEITPANRTKVAVGYTFHHLSNASIGESNPGMNSQVVYVRLSRTRSTAPTK